MIDIVINSTGTLPKHAKELSSQPSYELNILAAIGNNPTYPPLASLLARTCKLAEGEWLVVSPIHWQATHNDALITASAKDLHLTTLEAQLWFNELTSFFKEEQLELHFYQPELWLLKIVNTPTLAAPSLFTISHQSLMPVLAKLDKTLYWQRCLTEVQMYMSSHSLNNERPAHLTINGLWFWGQGNFQWPLARKIITNDSSLLESAATQDVSISSLSSSSRFEKDDLIVINDLRQIDLASLEKKLLKFNVNWYWNNMSYEKRTSRWGLLRWRS